MMEETARLSIKFIMYCYFGKLDAPVDSAINRAYVDMAAHTLTGFDSSDSKWAARKRASDTIKCKLEKLEGKTDYDAWHNETCKAIQACYTDPVLTYGQAQKWVNMTMKYLYVLSSVFNATGEVGQMDTISAFFKKKDNVEKLHIPLDSYTLKGLGKKAVWSKIENKDQYDELRSGQDFLWELENWPKLAEKYGNDVRESYSYYLKKHK